MERKPSVDPEFKLEEVIKSLNPTTYNVSKFPGLRGIYFSFHSIPDIEFKARQAGRMFDIFVCYEYLTIPKESRINTLHMGIQTSPDTMKEKINNFLSNVTNILLPAIQKAKEEEEEKRKEYQRINDILSPLSTNNLGHREGTLRINDLPVTVCISENGTLTLIAKEIKPDDIYNFILRK